MIKILIKYNQYSVQLGQVKMNNRKCTEINMYIFGELFEISV